MNNLEKFIDWLSPLRCSCSEYDCYLKTIPEAFPEREKDISEFKDEQDYFNDELNSITNWLIHWRNSEFDKNKFALLITIYVDEPYLTFYGDNKKKENEEGQLYLKGKFPIETGAEVINLFLNILNRC